MTSAEKSSIDASEETSSQVPVVNSAMQSQQSLRYSVAEAMQRYFKDLDGQDTTDLYELVMNEVEPPLLAAVMNYTRQNQSRTAEMLGLNRGTLRKKLKQYNLL
ncbi:MAG: DNA-binding transcriptional regulator Fis [Porticoccaceae bacterium]|jgi:Fis family transcriptional regulator|nr:DNA-binding transcriptional regulator Fis [Porticoccaceae bacterium]